MLCYVVVVVFVVFELCGYVESILHIALLLLSSKLLLNYPFLPSENKMPQGGGVKQQGGSQNHREEHPAILAWREPCCCCCYH